jgi:hypothetical protein
MATDKRPAVARVTTPSSLNQVESCQTQIEIFGGRRGGPEDTMTLLSELQCIVAELALGSRPLNDLRSWLEDHVEDVLESDDKRLTELDGLGWTLIGELDRGDRDEESVRAELGAVASPR